MRAILIIAAAVLVTAAATADDKTDRERRVRVALALADTVPAPAATADCGKCREDLPAARADALREGKPLVLFVGGCPGGQLAEAVCKGGGIPVKAAEYDDAGAHPRAQKRVVILEPTADRLGFTRQDLPAATTSRELQERVRAVVRPAVSAPLNWQF